ncbi:porin [Burkholderia sp. Ac-20353]|uniref:porin n=1 Tax=Burkholderia sp. Ac-20353 TaxID=2703894 RepID=UPI00197BE1A4|nr:porin [Burkholderia sp. Ac-20353]MBN3785991.1 porin [Burkholderia sp. Ac-20353]
MNNVKVSIFAVAAAIPAISSAQSSVSISGLIDAGVSYVSNQHGGSSIMFDSGILSPSLLMLKGTEDLGGGSKAIFELTSQFDIGSGKTIPASGSIFDRTALVGITNDRYGSITLGDQYEFMFDSLTVGNFDGAFLFGGLYDFRQGPFSKLGIPNNPTGSFDFDRMAGGTRVANSVKYRSPVLGGVSFGAMYGLGGKPGAFSANSTVSAGLNYEQGPLGLGAAYTSERYQDLGNGNDSIRNFGFGAHYAFGPVLGMLLYTNTKNTASNAGINVYKAGAQWQVSAPWVVGLDYTFMKGNDVLSNNKAHQISAAVQYLFSKRTLAYVELVHQRASGDSNAGAWINGLFQTGSGSSTGVQTIVRLALQTKF